MIEFNLLPEDLKVAQKKKAALKMEMPKIPLFPVVVAVVFIYILVHIVINLSAAIQKNRLVRLNEELRNLAPEEVTATSLKNRVEELNKRFSAIDSLASGSLLWSKKLYDLNGAMIDGVWLRLLYLSTEKSKGVSAVLRAATATPGTQPTSRQTLVLEGSAVSPTSGEETAIVGRFIESIRNNKDFFDDFEDIKLSSSQRKKMGNTEIMDFTIVCYFKRGRSYFEKLEGAGK